VINYASSATKKLLQAWAASSNQTTAANERLETKIGLYNSATAITSITMVPGGGTITSGTYELLGIN
jgi:ethanolamine utilization microcompartment shell protein EutS